MFDGGQYSYNHRLLREAMPLTCANLLSAWAAILVAGINGIAVANANELITTNELCNALTEQIRFLDGKTVRFDCETYFGTGASCVPVTGPPSDSHPMKRTVSAVRNGRKFRIESVYTDANADSKDIIGTRNIRTWDGIEARILDYDKGESLPRAAFILGAPDRSFGIDSFLTWLGIWAFRTDEPKTFLDLLIGEQLRGPEIMSDGRTRWRGGVFPEHILYARRVDGEIELSECELRYYREGRIGQDDQIQASVRWLFGPMRRDRGERIASSAEVRVCQWRGGSPTEDFWGFERITLGEVVEESITDHTFRESVGVAGTMGDGRYRISYEQGKTYINVDGRILETNEPVFGDDVGHHLERWIEKGRWRQDIHDPIKHTSTIGSELMPLIAAAGVAGATIVTLRRSRRMATFILVTLVSATLILDACKQSSQPSSSQPRHKEAMLIHDFGKVVLDKNSQKLTYTFKIANGKSSPLEIADIKKTCGCVEVNVSERHIEPHATTDIAVSLEVKHVGDNSQGAIVLFSDGSNCALKVAAYGTKGFELLAIPMMLIPQHNELALRLCAVDTEGNGEQDLPRVIEPTGVTLKSSGWKTLEDHAVNPDRPTRQVADAVLDFANYSGEFPAKIVLQSRPGDSCKFVVGEAPIPSCN